MKFTSNSWPFIQNFSSWDSRTGKTNALLNLVSHQPDVDRIYFYAKDPYEATYQLLINKLKGADIKYFNDFETFIDYSNDINDIYKIIEE